MTEPESRTSRIRVLIVDDHELMRHGLFEMLSAQGDLEVCGQATDLAGAVAAARQANVDIAVVDIALKESNGLDVLKRLQSFPEIKTIVYSMYEESLYAERALRAGAMGYVNKQEPARHLVEAIRRVRLGRTWLSEAMTERFVRKAVGAASTRDPVETLSDRELQVFELLGEGLTSQRIAERLHLSPRTVDTYRERLKAKLNLRSSTELIRAAMQYVLAKGEE